MHCSCLDITFNFLFDSYTDFDKNPNATEMYKQVYGYQWGELPDREMDKQHNTNDQSSVLSDSMGQQSEKVSSIAFQQSPTPSNHEGQNVSTEPSFSLPTNPTKRFSIPKGYALKNWSSEDFHSKRDEKIVAFIFILLLLLLCNIGILCSKALIFNETDKSNFALVNGDKVRKCPEKEYDGNCFEVTDTQNHVIYRSDNDKRILNYFRCSFSAPETANDKCMGEYIFSHNSTVVWYHRLYFDKITSKHSLIVGPENLNTEEYRFPKIRHMLQEPYNWIIGYEDIPPDEYPGHQLYVRGKVMVDSCSEI